MSEPTQEQLTAVRDAIQAAVLTIPPGEISMWPSEWVMCCAWVDVDGDTWLTRLKSNEKMPDYRVEGLLRTAEPSTWDAALERDDG